MIIRPEAEADLADARDWYERQQEGLGDAFLESVEAAFEKIDLMPELHPIISQGIRRHRTRRFPFTIYYRLEAGEVVVIGIFHSRRDPRAWKSRA
jgi:plasmid stabilization system protein ParE